jgi:hypothetical protein
MIKTKTRVQRNPTEMAIFGQKKAIFVVQAHWSLVVIHCTKLHDSSVLKIVHDWLGRRMDRAKYV